MPEPPRLTSTEVPTDGVVGLRLPTVGPHSVVTSTYPVDIVDAAGNLVAGRLDPVVGPYVAWHPEEALPAGATLTVVAGGDTTSPNLAASLTFTVVESLGVISPPDAAVEVELVDLSFSNQDCCSSHCFDTFRSWGVLAQLSAVFEASPAQFGQYVYGFSWPSNEPVSWSEAPTLSVLPSTDGGSAFVPCRTLWAQPLAGGAPVQLTEGCVSEDALVPAGQEYPALDDDLSYERCPEPPSVLRQEWCEVNRETCIASTDACPGYMDHCPATPTASEDAAVSAGDGADEPHRRTRSLSEDGCQITYPGTGASWLHSLILLLMLAVRSFSRRAPRHRGSA